MTEDIKEVTEQPIETEEQPVEEQPVEEETSEEPIKIDDLVDLDDDDDDDDDDGQSGTARTIEAMREMIRAELNKTKETKETKETKVDNTATKEDIEKLYQNIMYQQQADKEVQASTNKSMEYLNEVQSQIKKLGVDVNSAQGKMLLSYSEQMFTNLAYNERLQKGKEYLKPKDVERIKKEHWRGFKPMLEGFSGKSTIAKAKVAETSVAGAATNPSTPVKASDFDKQMKAYQEKREQGKLTAVDANEMQKLIRQLKR